MTNLSRRRKEPGKLKTMNNHDQFLKRITKSLYYSKVPIEQCLSLPVTELAAELFTEVKNGHTLERLDVEEASRISRTACVSTCSLVLSLLYLERLKDCNPEYLQRVAPSELFLVSLMVASKFLNDDGEEDEVFNSKWAFSGRVSVAHMNQLEKEFLEAIDWAIFVQKKDFWERLQRLEKDIAYKEARKRGWFSYTELNCVMDSMQLNSIAHTVINVSSICLATYAAGIATLLGSALVASYFPGTVLSPRQPSPITNATKTELSPIMDTSIAMVDSVPDDILMPNFSPFSLNCNETRNDDPSIKNDDGINDNWQWWLNPVMAWLPEYSKFNSNQNLITKNGQSEYMDTLLRSATFLLNPITLLQDIDDMVLEVKWKVLGIDLKLLMHDWRNYASYVTKTTLGYQF